MDEDFFEKLAAADEEAALRAPASLKARLYTALIEEQQRTGALEELSETRAAGRGLCVFEQLVQISPLGHKAETVFYCRVCHARVLAEHLDNPPIWWPNCPYSHFKKI